MCTFSYYLLPLIAQKINLCPCMAWKCILHILGKHDGLVMCVYVIKWCMLEGKATLILNVWNVFWVIDSIFFFLSTHLLRIQTVTNWLLSCFGNPMLCFLVWESSCWWPVFFTCLYFIIFFFLNLEWTSLKAFFFSSRSVIQKVVLSQQVGETYIKSHPGKWSFSGCS